MKILAIEDDEGIHDTLELFFKITMSEAEFYGARAGISGLTLVQEMQPDIIILDLGLPDISGYEVLERIRETIETPVIILTARTEQSTRIRCMELGANDVIIKPFRRDTMMGSINNLLVRKREETYAG